MKTGLVCSLAHTRTLVAGITKPYKLVTTVEVAGKNR